MEMPKVCIVTPIHNDWVATRRFLRSVADLTYPNVETIIVDDGSVDGSSERIAEEFPEVTVMAGNGNLWWTGATNLGCTEALARRADFIYTCNNDALLDPDAVASSVACARDNGKALIGSTVFYQGEPDRVWFSGARLDRSSGEITHDTQSWPMAHGARAVPVLTGMGMLIPVEAFRDLGGFDAAHFPHYLADCDFSLRAAERGYQLLVAPGSHLFNDVSSAWSVREFARGRVRFLFEMLTSERSAFWVTGRRRFYRRHWGPGWRVALVRLYLTWFRTYAAPLLVRKVLPFTKRRTSR